MNIKKLLLRNETALIIAIITTYQNNSLEYKRENPSSISTIKTIYMLANLAVTLFLRRLKNPSMILQNFLIN